MSASQKPATPGQPRHIAQMIERRIGPDLPFIAADVERLNLLADQLDADKKTIAELRDLNGAAELLLQGKDEKLSAAGLKIVELEKANNNLASRVLIAEREANDEHRIRIAAEDEAATLAGEKDRMADRLRLAVRGRNDAESALFRVGRKLRDARLRIEDLEQEHGGEATGDEIAVVFRYRKGDGTGISVEDASDLAVKLGQQFEAEIEGLDEPENEGSDKVA